MKRSLRRLRALGGEALDLLLPRTCAGCGVETVSLCGHCLTRLVPEPFTVVPRYGLLPVSGSGEYIKTLRSVIVALKSRRRTDVLPVLALLLSAAIAQALEGEGYAGGEVVVVPVPTSAAALRERGRDLVAELADRACELLAEDGLDIRAVRALTTVRHRDQVGSGAHARRRNVRGTHRMRKGVGVPGARAHVVLVDDVLTTGATLAESARALRSGGWRPASCAVMAITGDGHDPGGTPSDQKDAPM